MDEYILQDDEFALLRAFIYKVTGISLSDTKRELVRSRLQKRLRKHQLTCYRDYYELLRRQPDDSEEIVEFVNCVTTNKTGFFREPHHFDFVTQTLLPQWKQQVRREERLPCLRVWHAGCSTGEEPYTLAIVLREALKNDANLTFRQLASDIDTHVLTHAANGIYEQERTDPVPPNLLSRYFLKGRNGQNGSVKVRAELQGNLTFRRINLLDEPWPLKPETQFDIIFCRNVVIYFDKPTRQKLFARFAERLRPGGYLFIGHSESLLGISDAFLSLGKTIYQLPDRMEARKQAA